VQSLEQIPLGVRVTNAMAAYAAYVAKTFWPSHLAVYYPHSMDALPLWLAGGALLLLFAATAFFIARRKDYPFGIVGWLWFLGTLVPVIGIVQVGGQAMADRYTYVPIIGIFIAVVWGISRFVEKKKAWSNSVAAVACLVMTMLGITAWKQVGYWKDSASLFDQTLHVTNNNQLAHNQLGQALYATGKVDEAIQHFEAALRITPQYLSAHINLGDACKAKGKLDEAVNAYRRVLQFVPSHENAKNNLGVVLAIQGKMHESIALFSQVLEADPENVRAHNNLGIALAQQGKFDEATRHFREALRIDPNSESAQKNLRLVLNRLGHP
jgi:tetratricopeptide (TPR) repeat protein